MMSARILLLTAVFQVLRGVAGTTTCCPLARIVHANYAPNQQSDNTVSLKIPEGGAELCKRVRSVLRDPWDSATKLMDETNSEYPRIWQMRTVSMQTFLPLLHDLGEFDNYWKTTEDGKVVGTDERILAISTDASPTQYGMSQMSDAALTAPCVAFRGNIKWLLKGLSNHGVTVLIMPTPHVKADWDEWAASLPLDTDSQCVTKYGCGLKVYQPELSDDVFTQVKRGMELFNRYMECVPCNRDEFLASISVPSSSVVSSAPSTSVSSAENPVEKADEKKESAADRIQVTFILLSVGISVAVYVY